MTEPERVQQVYVVNRLSFMETVLAVALGVAAGAVVLALAMLNVNL